MKTIHLPHCFKLKFARTSLFKFTDKKNESENEKTYPPKPSLDLNEYNQKEFIREGGDDMDKTKPFDNLQTKIFSPELREQYEKRKDIFHTLDTPYLKKPEKEVKSENNKK
jgi:hypothetical protein